MAASLSVIPWAHLFVKAHPLRATLDHFCEIEWLSRGSYGVYMAATRSTSNSFSQKFPCMSLTDRFCEGVAVALTH